MRSSVDVFSSVFIYFSSTVHHNVLMNGRFFCVCIMMIISTVLHEYIYLVCIMPMKKKPQKWSRDQSIKHLSDEMIQKFFPFCNYHQSRNLCFHRQHTTTCLFCTSFFFLDLILHIHARSSYCAVSSAFVYFFNGSTERQK